MKKLWGGEGLNALADKFNKSISVDKRLWAEDIAGSIAHVTMLGKCGIITNSEADETVSALCSIKTNIESGKLAIDEDAEDIHTFIENELTKLLPVVGKKLHTGRSRNDQVATDMRLWCARATDDISGLLDGLLAVIADLKKTHAKTVMCGYTHLQPAQPITFGYHMGAYAEMFGRDLERLADCKKRILISPLGACALAGTTYPLDKNLTAKLLGFNECAKNTLDAVSDRDYCVELLSALSLIMAHLSRLSEEIILWSSQEFGYIKLSDAFSTGSSVMPQKKNPDIAELTRGKTGRVYGDLMSMLTTLKGLPLAYNKDMQEDKEAIFDGIDTVSACLEVFTPMLSAMTVNADKMLERARHGFICATDVADYLVKAGMPFRDAYKTVKALVEECLKTDRALDELGLDEFKAHSPLFKDDIFEAIDLKNCVAKRGIL